MGTNQAKRGNQLAQASLNESKRQYDEQKRKEDKQKAVAMANAMGAKKSSNQAYSNNFAQSTDFTTGTNGSYNVLTAGGTPTVIGNLLSGAGTAGSNDTLGG
jgi:hypothetical protein